jgi:hypothetical protein
MSLRERAGGSGRGSLPARNPLGRAIDRPVFWWSAGGIFLVNALLSAAEGHWVLAALQALTCLWAGVAGVTARLTAPGCQEPTVGPPKRTPEGPYGSS